MSLMYATPTSLDTPFRFAGPATVVRVFCASKPRLQIQEMRTEGQAVAEAGDRLTALALYPQQVMLTYQKEFRTEL